MLDKFPVIGYNDAAGVSDITQRIPQLATSATVSFPQGGPTRPDIVADRVYDESNLDWLVVLSNDVVDPLDISIVSDQEFNLMIVKKYGSVEAAKQQIAYFLNNWAIDSEDTIDEVVYDDLVPAVKQLYDVIRNHYGAVISYKRKKINLRRSTSLTAFYSVANADLTTGQYIWLKNGATVVGTARVRFVSSSRVTVDHVVGNYQCTHISDGATTWAVTEVLPPVKTISDEEVPYYSPVSVYDDLYYQLTERRRTVAVVPKSQAQEVAKRVTDTF